eukprot:SAG11_NODE_1087_length_5925_cov_2.708376_9_plen_227_part_00
MPAPSCTPCRSSILSGRYFWQTGLGAILDGARWDESIPSFPLELEAKGGYFIGHTYKVWSPGRTANAPIGATRTQYQRAGRQFAHFSQYVTANAEAMGVEGAKAELYKETRLNFQSFLDARPDGRPFFYWWGPSNTHRSWQRGSGKALWGLEPKRILGKLPPFLPDVHEVREDVCDCAPSTTIWGSAYLLRRPSLSCGGCGGRRSGGVPGGRRRAGRAARGAGGAR